ncbi:recombinase family protein [Vibrio fortis]|uniref:recombinase family protein n=1 Tax=Vibrio fortis TaxID=212667 RepID=UPI0038CDA4C7
MKAYIYSRISSKAQKTGHGLDRQQDITLAYAAQNNFTVADEVFQDVASGYHGKQMEGRLGVFLEAIKQGKVTTPAALIVESLDRLGREHTMDALPRFIDIVNSGVLIHEVSTGIVYNREETHKLHIAIAIMERAHNESLMKAKRATAAADKRLKKAQQGEGIISHNLPCWIENKGGQLVLIEKYAVVIRRMFELYISGKGSNKVAETLREEKHPYFTSNVHSKKIRNHVWTDQRVMDIIKKDSVCGVFRSIVKTDVVIDGYYPAAVDKATFERAQAIRTSRTKSRRKSKKGLNVLSGLLRCKHCGSSLQYTKSHSNKQKTHTYENLRCRDRAAKLGCDSKSIPLRPLEKLILGWVGSIPLYDIKEASNNEMNQKKAELTQLEQQAENLVELLASGLQRVKDKYLQLEQKIDELKNEIAELGFVSSGCNVDKIDYFQAINLDNEEYREQVQQELALIIDRLSIYCDGKDVEIDVHLNSKIHNFQSFVGKKKDIEKARMTQRVLRPAARSVDTFVD